MDDPDLERLDSRSAVELTEIDPAPLDDPDADAVTEEGATSPKSPSSSIFASTSSTLGLNHGPAFYLLRLQRYSSYAFTLFTTLHIANTSLIPLLTRSLPASDPYLLLTRPLYQSPPLEPLLITAPLALHIASGLALRLYRRRTALARYGAHSYKERAALPWPTLSGTSALGWMLAPLVAGHAFVNRVLPLWYEGGSANVGLEYVAHGFARHPWVSGVVYGALVGVGVWHGTWGWAKWLGLSPEKMGGGELGRRERVRRRRIINSIAAAVAGIWMLGGLGIVARGGEASGWLGREYDGLYSRMPVFGAWY
ncbi:hypothetical protein EJ06DRAFT_544030 [Trichodelitschia bisporula]|uniref:Mitochondrial adapter protein MCP1 transmembrane domain-containing protein n=1 Tax=Trichodelitschia bisporula TaxID=703511 RepID=A0A6G1HQY6_9PEZI|nr:hypothetical protein EJ06DRAFT_544030 [Trichodelitschia bisporula]